MLWSEPETAAPFSYSHFECLSGYFCLSSTCLSLWVRWNLNNSEKSISHLSLSLSLSLSCLSLSTWAVFKQKWAPSIKNAEDSSSESRSAESSEITRNNQSALNLSPTWSVQNKYGDAFKNDFRAQLGVMMKIHSRFIARPLYRFTHVESFQPGFQVLYNGHESI